MPKELKQKMGERPLERHYVICLIQENYINKIERVRFGKGVVTKKHNSVQQSVLRICGPLVEHTVSLGIFFTNGDTFAIFILYKRILNPTIYSPK